MHAWSRIAIFFAALMLSACAHGDPSVHTSTIIRHIYQVGDHLEVERCDSTDTIFAGIVEGNCRREPLQVEALPPPPQKQVSVEEAKKAMNAGH